MSRLPGSYAPETMSSRIAVHTASAEIRRPPWTAVVSPFISGPALSNLRLNARETHPWNAR
ncbi:hypothetical protein TPA0910_63150 [Streptomyces hygroscopicus subsp. sporocinereus]|uniref:Uncharacterized protein n=1 Tax=Streptomyces hygroscopicus TaxID=1912 RepID=A0ABQ3U8E8_STRHY|nr:hypothetical protein TPA0910_63150 [Streptomyces hygroscopicus]